MYHGEYTLQETVILTQLNLNMQARDLERMAHVVSTTDDLEETGRVLDERMEIWTFVCLLMQNLMHCNELCLT